MQMNPRDGVYKEQYVASIADDDKSSTMQFRKPHHHGYGDRQNQHHVAYGGKHHDQYRRHDCDNIYKNENEYLNGYNDRHKNGHGYEEERRDEMWKVSTDYSGHGHGHGHGHNAEKMQYGYGAHQGHNGHPPHMEHQFKFTERFEDKHKRVPIWNAKGI